MQTLIEIPMIAKVTAKVKAKLVIDSIVDATFEIQGPLDTDKDGNPEFHFLIDLPGEAFDQQFKVELPVELLTKGLPAMIAAALDQITEHIPMRGTLLKVLKELF